MYTFSGPDGACPTGGLIEGTDHNLYGTTAMGGANNLGTIFTLNVPAYRAIRINPVVAPPAAPTRPASTW